MLGENSTNVKLNQSYIVRNMYRREHNGKYLGVRAIEKRLGEVSVYLPFPFQMQDLLNLIMKKPEPFPYYNACLSQFIRRVSLSFNSLWTKGTWTLRQVVEYYLGGSTINQIYKGKIKSGLKHSLFINCVIFDRLWMLGGFFFRNIKLLKMQETIYKTACTAPSTWLVLREC